MDEQRVPPALSADPTESLDLPKMPRRLPAGRHGLPREFVVRNQRERMLDGMARAVAEKGYNATSVADVLERAGVSRKTFYEHFRDKEDCFLQTFDEVAAGLLYRVDKAFRGETDEEEGAEGEELPWEARIRRGLARFIEVLVREPDFARMCLVESVQAGPKALERYFAMVRRFADYVDQGRELGAPGVVPEFTALSVVTGVTGVIYMRLATGEVEDLLDLLPEFTFFILTPYLGPDRAREQAEIAVQEFKLTAKKS